MLGKIGLAALALCLAVALVGCGGGEESTGTQATEAAKAQADQGSQKPATATNDAGDEGRQGDDAAPARTRAAMKNQNPDKGQAATTSKSEAKKAPEDDPPANLSDEEICEREPSACRPNEDTPPDYSNPDVRRAEERAEEPDEPVKCDSSDCERLRREGR